MCFENKWQGGLPVSAKMAITSLERANMFFASLTPSSDCRSLFKALRQERNTHKMENIPAGREQTGRWEISRKSCLRSFSYRENDKVSEKLIFHHCNQLRKFCLEHLFVRVWKRGERTHFAKLRSHSADGS